jgi:hypothetical protein
MRATGEENGTKLYEGNRRIEPGGYLTLHEEEKCACGSSVALVGERGRERERERERE